ncbi:MAG: hypothetical protein ACK4N5_21480, partial [Myxococcales bacterium]
MTGRIGWWCCFQMEARMERVPSPMEIRAFRAARSRAEFGKLLGVTALTVYRWELPPESPELRRPRGKILKRLQELMAGSEAAVSAVPPTPLALEPGEQAALAPALLAVEDCRPDAETTLMRLLASGELRSDAARAQASLALARLQVLARHDTRSAFTMLLALDVERLPLPLQLEYHLVAALVHGHTDAQLFHPGRAQHHATLAEALLAHGHADHRFRVWHARSTIAAAMYDNALIARAMEDFPVSRVHATT